MHTTVMSILAAVIVMVEGLQKGMAELCELLCALRDKIEEELQQEREQGIPEMLPLREAATRSKLNMNTMREIVRTGQVVYRQFGTGKNAPIYINKHSFVRYLNGEDGRMIDMPLPKKGDVPVMLTVQECSKRSGLHICLIRDLYHQGHLEGTQIAIGKRSRIYIQEESLLRYLRTSDQQPL